MHKKDKIRSIRVNLLAAIIPSTIIIFSIVVGIIFSDLRKELEYQEEVTLLKHTKEIIATIVGEFHVKENTLDNMIRYISENTRNSGEAWAYLLSHFGEKVNQDPKHAKEYLEKRDEVISQLEKKELRDSSWNIKKLLERKDTNENAFDAGSKFAYIGLEDGTYRDSSGWVPVEGIDDPYDPRIRPWYKIGLEAGGKFGYTEPYAEKRTKEALVSLTKTIQIGNKKGVIALGCSIAPIMQRVETTLENAENDNEIIILSKGSKNTKPRYVYSSEFKSLSEHFSDYDEQETNPDLKTIYENADSSEGVTRHKNNIIVYSDIPSLNWKIFISVDKKIVDDKIFAILLKSTIFMLIGIIIIMLIIAFLLNKFLKPSSRLNDFALSLKSGNLSEELEIKGKDEFAMMGRSLILFSI